MLYQLPNTTRVKIMLNAMLGTECEVNENSDLWESDAPQYIGVYRDTEDKLVAVCASDIPFGAFAGSALSMIPPGQAEEVAKSTELSEMMRANLYELMNILSRDLMSTDSPHLRLVEMHKSDELTDDIKSLLKNSPDRCGFQTTIERYGNGKFGIVVT